MGTGRLLLMLRQPRTDAGSRAPHQRHGKSRVFVLSLWPKAQMKNRVETARTAEKRSALQGGKGSSKILAAVLIGALLLGGACFLLARAADAARIRPARIFQSGMVLQRDKPLPVWGRALPGRKLRLEFAGQLVFARADQEGHWEASLAPLAADSEGRKLSIAYDPPLCALLPAAGRAELDDVLVGDLWLCSGQSNMEFGCGRLTGAEAENAAAAADPFIRIFLIEKAAGIDRRGELESGRWLPAAGATLKSGGWGGFSAVAWFFAQRLRQDIDVPLGLIQSTYGATRISAWLPRGLIEDNPAFAAEKKTLAAIDLKPELRARLASISEKKDIVPTSCYNAMIAPLEPMALKGILWYQGETDMGSGMRYAAWMRAQIAAWRAAFRDMELPFYYVALPPYKYGLEGQLPEFTEAQASCLDVPHTGMAVIIDQGNYDDIHPAHKAAVGERLARIALCRLYGRKGLETEGPQLEKISTVIIADAGYALPRRPQRGLKLEFSHSGGGLSLECGGRMAGSSTEGPLPDFELAGSDGVYRNAFVRLNGGDIVLWSPLVQQPRSVRYAWSNNPHTYIYNTEELPALAFRAETGFSARAR